MRTCSSRFPWKSMVGSDVFPTEIVPFQGTKSFVFEGFSPLIWWEFSRCLKPPSVSWPTWQAGYEVEARFPPLFIHVTRGFGRSQHFKTYRKTHRSRDRHRSFHFSSEGNQRIHPRDVLTLQVGSKKCTFTPSIYKYTAVLFRSCFAACSFSYVPVWHPEISAHSFCPSVSFEKKSLNIGHILD